VQGPGFLGQPCTPVYSDRAGLLCSKAAAIAAAAANINTISCCKTVQLVEQL
jgi:hypothetical protein